MAQKRKREDDSTESDAKRRVMNITLPEHHSDYDSEEGCESSGECFLGEWTEETHGDAQSRPLTGNEASSGSSGESDGEDKEESGSDSDG